MQDGNFNTNYTITESGGVNVEQAFNAINSAIQKSAQSVESLRAVSTSLSKTEFFPAWREGLNNISLLSERMKSLSEGFNTANVGSVVWANFNSELRKSQNEMQLIHMMAAEMFDPIANSTSTVINSLSALTQKIAYMRNELMSIDKSTPAFAALQNKIAMTEAELAKFNMVVSATTKRTGDYNMVGINTARLFSDMGYAAQSFSFGVMSIGNNISPLVESLKRAKSAGQSWKDILISTFTGTSGWLVGINILVSAITAYSIATREAGQNTQDWDLKTLIGNVNAYAESLKKVNKQLQEMSSADISKTIDMLNKKLADSILEQAKLYGLMAQNPALSILYGGQYDKLQEDMKKYMDTIGSAFKTMNDKNRAGTPNYLREQIKELTDAFDAGDKSLAPKINSLKAQLRSWEDLINPSKTKNKKTTTKNKKTTWIDNEELDAKIEDFSDRIKKQKEYFDTVLFADPKAMSYFQEQIHIVAQKMAEEGLDGKAYEIAETKKLMNKFFEWQKENDPEQNKDRITYKKRILDFQVQAIPDPFSREIAIARNTADDTLSIYKDMLNKKTISEKEFEDIRLLIEQDYTRKASDIEAKVDKQRVQVYRGLLTEFGKLGSNLRTIFKSAGDSFIGQMLEALQIVQAIAEVIESIKTISSIFDVLSTGVGIATGGAIVGGNNTTSQPMQSQTYNVNIGGTTVARLTAEGYKLATNLRYMN